jgi:hypothetical protein
MLDMRYYHLFYSNGIYLPSLQQNISGNAIDADTSVPQYLPTHPRHWIRLTA